MRPATPADVPDIARIARLARATAMPWLPVLHSEEGDRKFYMRCLTGDPLHAITVMDSGNTVLGFIATTEGWVEHLYIHPAHWYCGHGSSLLRLAQSRADELALWVFADNLPAQQFYEKHGFQVEKRTDGAHNEEKCPDARMRWTRAQKGKT